MNETIIAVDEAQEIQDNLFEAAVNVASVHQRLQSRWFLSDLEKQTLQTMDDRLANYTEAQSSILLSRCVADSWKQLGRLSEDQQRYLLEALDYIDFYLK